MHRNIVFPAILIAAFLVSENCARAEVVTAFLVEGPSLKIEYEKSFSRERAFSLGREIASKMWISVCSGKLSKACSPEPGYYGVELSLFRGNAGEVACLATISGKGARFIGTQPPKYIEVAHLRCSTKQSFFIEDFS